MLDYELWKCLHDILNIAQAEDFWEGGHSIGYNLPDGKHHLFIWIDHTPKGKVIVIEPNLVEDGAMEPCGRNGSCSIDDKEYLTVEIAWVIETQCR